MAISDLSMSYPDFKLLDTIDPEQFDLNNKEIRDKVNEIKNALNTILDGVIPGASGADKISMTAISPFTATKLQAHLQAVIDKLVGIVAGTSGADFIGTPAVVGLAGTTVASQLTAIKTLLDAATSTANTVTANLLTHKTSADHDARYYTEAEMDIKLAQVAPGGSGLYKQSTQVFIATEGQTIFTLTEGSYTAGNDRLQVFISGVKQFLDSGDFAETSGTSFTLSEGVASGTKVEACWLEGVIVNPADPITHASRHMAGGVDPLDALTLVHGDLIGKNYVNALINGNFDVWQRGTSATNPTLSMFIADRWKAQFAGTGFPNVQHSRQALTPGDVQGSYYFYRVSPDGAGTASMVNYKLVQFIEYGARTLCGSGKKVTVSFWARSSIANKRLGISFVQNYGTGGAVSAQEVINGTSFALTNIWTKYSFTVTTSTLVGKVFGTNNDDFFFADFNYAWDNTLLTRFNTSTAETFVGAGNIDIAQVQLCSGDVALPFQPRSFGEELQLCQRYYEKSYNANVAPGSLTSIGEVVGQASAAIAASTAGSLITPCHGMFKVQKRIIPTVTLYARDGTINAILAGGGSTRSGATASSASESQPVGFISLSTISAVPVPDRAQIQYQWIADAEL